MITVAFKSTRSEIEIRDIGKRKKANAEPILVLPALTLVLAILWAAGTTGCRNSTKSTEPVPSESRTSAVIVPTTAATPKPSQSEATPLTDIKVTPPAAFTPQQLAQNGNVRFLVPANAGDFLLIKVNEAVQPGKTPRAVMMRPHTTPKANYALSIGLPTKDPTAVRVIQEGGGCTYNSLYQLNQTAVYEIVFDTSEGRAKDYQYGIAFTALSKNDPIVDPGIRPEEISIDFRTFSNGQQLSVQPPALAEGCLDDSWPSHLAVKTASFAFRIIGVSGYKKVFPSESGLSLLEAAIAAGTTDAVERLPYANSDNGALNMWAREEVLKGVGWHGLRWIGGYGQDLLCGPSNLQYVFEGISDDGRFLILMRAAISHPAKEQRWAARGCVTDAEVPKINALLAKDLTAADPASFQPSLDRLDAVVQSLVFKY